MALADVGFNQKGFNVILRRGGCSCFSAALQDKVGLSLS